MLQTEPTPPVSTASAAVLLVRDLCAMARVLTDAKRQSLILFGDGAEAMSAALAATGIDCQAGAPKGIPAAAAGPVVLPMQPDQPSDLVSIAVPLSDRGQMLGSLELHCARPESLSRRNGAVLCALADRIAKTLADAAPSGNAPLRQMLALIAALADHDNNPPSRLLTGLLRLAAGEPLSMDEVSALHIAGLGHKTGDRMSLTAEGLAVLARSGVQPHPVPDGAHVVAIGDAPRRPSLAHATPPVWTPFARLTIGSDDFDIAEASDYDPIVFRLAGATGEWTELRHSLVDGWTEIAAEVLSATQDVTSEFVKMHMIRRRDLPLDEVAEIYELGPLCWMLRETETGYETRIRGEQWQPLRQPPAPAERAEPSRDRSHAIRALLQLWPDLPARIDHDVRSWVHRMVAGAKVAPATSRSAA